MHMKEASSLLWTDGCLADMVLSLGRGDPSKYPPAEPGALGCEPLKAAVRGR